MQDLIVLRFGCVESVFSSQIAQLRSHQFLIHPWTLTWNTKNNEGFGNDFPFQLGDFLMFHVNLPGYKFATTKSIWDADCFWKEMVALSQVRLQQIFSEISARVRASFGEHL